MKAEIVEPIVHAEEEEEDFNPRRRRDDMKKGGFRKALLDIDEDKVDASPEGSYFMSECSPCRYLICWICPFFFWGLCTTPTMQDLPSLAEHATVMNAEKKFEYIWPLVKGNPFRLMLAINYCFGAEFWIGGFIMACAALCQVFIPKVMQMFLESIFFPLKSDSTEMISRINTLREFLPSNHEIYPPNPSELTRDNNYIVWVYLGIMAVLYILNSWGTQYAMHIGSRVGMKVRTLVISRIYQKSLYLSGKSREKYSNGVIMNHCTMDAFKIERIHMLFHVGWSGIIIVGGSIIYLIDLIDWGTLSGIGANFCVVPFLIVVVVGFFGLRTVAIGISDNRVNKMNEILQSVRIIKFFSWEKSFEKKITGLRFVEVLIYRYIFILFSVLYSYLMAASSLVCMIAFITVYLVHGYLDPVTVFTSLTYFNLMKLPLAMMPTIITILLEMVISMRRIQGLLEADEIEDVAEGDNDVHPIIIKDGNFLWEVRKDEGKKEKRVRAKLPPEYVIEFCCKICKCCCKRICKCRKKVCSLCKKKKEFDEMEMDEKYNLGALKNINFKVKKGDLVMVIGKVGSGKSSLLYAILGEMRKKSGLLEVTGSVAFTSQLSWIQNETLYNNVLFGENENLEKWDAVVDCCCLQQDLEELKGGKNIEIGEKGINLSGGQKYRVQLARACYVPTDIVLLDDPLAAVDAHVGKKIFSKCIVEYLKDRTRVLVTHQLNYLNQADHIYYMEKGRIAEEGTYTELMEKRGLVYEEYHKYVASEKSSKIGKFLKIEENNDVKKDLSKNNIFSNPVEYGEEIEEEGESEEIEEEGESDDSKESEESKELEEGGEDKEEEIKIVETKVEGFETTEEKQHEHDLENILIQGTSIEEDDDIIRKAIAEAKENCPIRAKERIEAMKERTKIRERKIKEGNLNQAENKIIQHEIMKKGIISPAVIWAYIKAMGCKGFCPLITIFTVFVVVQFFLVSMDWWLTQWTNGTYNEKFGNEYHLHVYVDGFKNTVPREPILKYFDPDDYPPFSVKRPKYNMSDPKVVEMLKKNPLYPPPKYDNVTNSINCVNFSIPGSNFPVVRKNLPVDKYDCPSPISWCGCNDQYVPVMWDRSYDNGTEIEEGIGQIDSVAVYAVLGILSLFGMFFRSVVFTCFALTASQRLHNKALRRVLAAPMSFFDQTPIGRIITRFAYDLSEMDGQLVLFLSASLGMGFSVLGMMCLIIYDTNGWGALFVIPLIIVYFCFFLGFRKTSLEFKRLESVTKAHYLSHISESLNGTATIRAYRSRERFIKKLRKKLDVNNRAYYLLYTGIRWIGIWLGIFGLSFVSIVAIVLILIYYYWDSIELDPSETALALSYSIISTQMFFTVVQLYSEAEAIFNSVERLDYYAKHVPIEEPADDKKNVEKGFVKEGIIEFKNYSMKYRPELDVVLKDLSFKIGKFERIGIVGRTGSGKSSLMVALWRIVEPYAGEIILEGRSIKNFNINQLRNELSIIPQVATLFSGTVRSNLDPFREYSNKDIWEALRNSYMEEKIRDSPGKLNYGMEEGGANFSVGESQLLCLARALLRKTKVLVLDEATASVDIGTDCKIQKTIREAFKECTTLTIAHRIDTIIDCDRILVMDDGRAVEFDTARNLLGNTEKYHLFRDLVHETGEGNEKLLYDYAFGKKKFEIEIKENDEEEEIKKDEKVEKEEEVEESENVGYVETREIELEDIKPSSDHESSEDESD